MASDICCGFENARAGFSVQALDGKAHGLAEIEQLLIQTRVHGISEHRVAERTGSHGFQLPVALVTDGLRRFLEHEELIFGGGADGIAHLGGALEHAPQGAARADRFGAAGELAEKEYGFGFEGDVALGLGQHAHGGIGIGGVPAGELCIVVELVVRVPAENHVAEAEVFVEPREEFIAAEVFAAQDAVGVGDSDFDMFDAAVGQKFTNLGVLLHGWLPRGRFSTTPFFMTNVTRSTAVMSSRGEPGTATMSA
jgi:hypothetical protein